MNLNSEIIGANGAALYGVGGPAAYKTYERRGFCVSMEWLDGEPCMLIWPIRGQDAGVFGITLSSASKYADPSGHPTRECFRQCRSALLEVLGGSGIDVEVYALVDVVMDGMNALLTMPPAPLAVRNADKAAPIWEITEIDKESGKTIREASI